MGHHDKQLEFLGFFFPGVQARALSRLVNMVPAMTWSWYDAKVRPLLADEFDGAVVVGYSPSLTNMK